MSMDLTHAMAGSALRRASAIDDTVRVATAGLGDDARRIARLAATIAFDAGFAMRELLHADLADVATAPSTTSPAMEDEEP
ncbi:hypothetical protein [Sphingomonas sp. BK580]|uniref:hypothetical protein n=1 Tax=Sphingomonas sp. BK580 TaxID=2586972 RepID=UPI00162082BA|nr:hypothetical protein [Sphingomonas sp. BK580]MBB3691491.1 20S proteasome alpha/beta subunit [Sphingomonas sp. BK580]